MGRENWHPEQYLKPNTTYNTGRNGIACPGHILWGIIHNLEKVKYFVCLYARPPPPRHEHTGHGTPLHPRGADAGPPTTRSRSYRSTTLANPGGKVIPHLRPPRRSSTPHPGHPHPKRRHPHKQTKTSESAQFPNGFCDF